MENEKKNNAWDPVTATPDGGIVWHSYDGRTVVTHGDETPDQVANAVDADAAVAALSALAGDVDNAPHAEAKFIVLSPDGLPIAPEQYNSRAEAEAALTEWAKRFEQQGFYSAVDGRIALADLPGRCSIVEQKADNTVDSPCPNCHEADADRLVWQDDDETVRCSSCGESYKP